MVKIIVFGNQQICIDCVEFLKKNENVEVSCVVGSELSRDKQFGYSSLKEYCNKNGLTFYSPDKLDDNFFELIKSYNPDLCFSIYYRNILKKNFIDIPKKGFINIHPSLLPKYRGPAPTMWALIEGEKKVGVTIHYIDTGVDTGDIIAQLSFRMPLNISGFDLNTFMMKKGVVLFKKQFPLILKNKNQRKKQDDRKATYFGLFSPSTANINWFSDKESINNRVNALTKPYNGASSILKGKKVIIWKTQVLEGQLKGAGGPGKIVDKFGDGSFVVRTIDGFLKVVDYETGKIPNVKDFVQVGDRFEV